MSDDIQLAVMTRDDVPRVHAIERECFSMPWDISAYYGEVSNLSACYLVARTGGEIIGFGGMWTVGGEGHIVTLAVTQAYRRHGVGRLLMDALLAEARRRNMECVTLEVRVTNTPAQRLYTSLGFRTITYRRQYYADNGEDAAVMLLELDDAPL